MYNKSVSINLSSKCNAECAHCCFSCSPKSNQKMSNASIEKIIIDFCQNKDVEVISFTGGEIFLNYDYLESLLKITKSYDKKVTLISNGFWGASRRLLKKYFSDFQKYNVIALTISYDEFHAPFVKLNSVKRIFEYRLEYPNIDVSLNMAVTKDKMSDEIIKNLGSAIIGIKITKFPLISVGAAKCNIPDDMIHNFYDIDKDEKLLRCPGYEIVYHHDGEIYPCCSPAIFETELSLREDQNQGLERTIEKLNSNLLFYIIRREGLSWFVKILKDNNLLYEFDIPSEFSSVCSVCCKLFNSIEKINFFKPYMEEYYYETFEV
ncbi:MULTISPECIES: YydG family radical SAM peptide epimerase [Staphylococcus]|uniref:YydG family peptide radical SAM peptide maturase n=1 Tax=Staphylococcus pettenkoferi TaxID=170573 RepID=A0A2N6QHR0_9STAP|nr:MULTISPECIES: YydG family radical SAM peptide epimerase [Staphylococcus]MCI2791608.1 YydG family radical SAM peptide epimerase [Staphylococcus pettenkoferi]MCY1604468.1 YydG family radical SAM peptide epimerase [Staphylococcus pettenkoferi]OFK76581.1 YydG family peptide radical SAM peptide maturase [Staphylococcus sp. HMSC071G07]PMC19107.1 YydG family peptide radical SAM peptide maturase [Staphylococcus pettenkoferi]